jgi:hypothetical protein
LGVFGFINHAHAAATEQFEDAVVGDGLADHGRVGVGLRLRTGTGSGAILGEWWGFVNAEGHKSSARVA